MNFEKMKKKRVSQESPMRGQPLRGKKKTKTTWTKLWSSTSMNKMNPETGKEHDSGDGGGDRPEGSGRQLTMLAAACCPDTSEKDHSAGEHRIHALFQPDGVDVCGTAEWQWVRIDSVVDCGSAVSVAPENTVPWIPVM